MESNRNEDAALMHLCAQAAPLFARTEPGAYEAAVEGATAALTAHGVQPMPTPVSGEARRVFEREVLVAGMPLAAMPVESLYKPWSAGERAQLHASRGLYFGQSAAHMQAVFETLGLEIPKSFSAMPDHLSLLLELLSFYLEVGNRQAARDLVRDHFDWLDAYDAELADRADRAADAPIFETEVREHVLAGISSMRELVHALDGAVHGWADGFDAGCIEAAQKQER